MYIKRFSGRMKIALSILVLILLSFSVSVTWKNLWRDNSILTREPCGPPCWMGITPGKTTADDAYKILDSSSIIKRNSLKRNGSLETGGLLWKWRASGKRISPGLSWEDGVVDKIVLGVNIEISVSEILELYGDPDTITIANGGIPEAWYFIIVLHYPRVGIDFNAYTGEFDSQLNPSTNVEVVTYYPPTTLNELMDQMITKSGYTVDDFQSWVGYGDIPSLYKVVE